MSEHIQVVTTVPDRETAERIAQLLVERKLAACVQIAGPIRSVYRWQGQVEGADELVLTVKTRHSAFDALKAAVLEAHPYDVPEIVALPIVAGHAPYLQWIDENTTPSAE